jgi:hypothetical protein
VEGVTQEDGTRCLVFCEVVLDDHPELMGGLVRLHGEVEDGVIDGAIRPTTNAGVSLQPCVGERVRRPVPLMCARRPNFPHNDSKDFHWV